MTDEPITRRDALLRGGVSMAALAAYLAGPAAGGALAAARRAAAGVTGTTITVATASTPWLASYQKVVSLYQQETGNQVNLQVFPFAGLLTQQANAIQNKSGAFDVFQINEGWTGAFYDRGWVLPLSAVQPKFAWPAHVIGYDGVGRWDKKARDTSSDGIPYALPINGNAQVLGYRKDIYQKLGLRIPTTFAQAIANGVKAQKAGLVKYGYTTRGMGDRGGNSVTFDFGAVLNGYGADWFRNPDEGDWTPTIDSEAAQEAMATYLKLLALGPQPAQTVGQPQVLAIMQAGQALQGHFVEALAPNLDDPRSSTVVGKIGYAVVPAGVGNKHAPQTGTWVLGIPSVGVSPAQRRAGLAFVEWLVSAHAQQQWASYGGIITRDDVLKTPLAHTGTTRWMRAARYSTPYYHRGIRYPFGPTMTGVTEVRITEMVAGQLSVKDGMRTMAREIGKVARLWKAGKMG
jgi:multiple sugar transport system substrate-binding protein